MRIVGLASGPAAACMVFVGYIVWPGNVLAQTGENVVHQKGNVRYRVPDGWKETVKDRSTLLIPADVTSDQKCLIALLPGQEFSGDLKVAFEKLLDNGLASGEKILQSGELQKVTLASAPEVPAYQKSLIVQDKDGNATIRAFVAAHPGRKRIELAVIVVNSREALQHYQPGIKSFLATWTFANIGGAAKNDPGGHVTEATEVPTAPSDARGDENAIRNEPEPNAKPGELTGLFFGQHIESSFNGFSGTMQSGLVRTWYYFLPGGRVYYGLPQEGVSSFHWQQHLQKDPGNCGTFHLEGDKIVIAWKGIPKPWRMAFSQKGNHLNIGNESLEKMVTPVGAHFSGTYGLTTYTAVSGGGVGGDHKIVLRSNGEFQETGIVGFTVTGPSANATGRTGDGGNGTYRVTANGLELTYSDGRNRRIPLQVQASQAKTATPDFLIISGVLWLKR